MTGAGAVLLSIVLFPGVVVAIQSGLLTDRVCAAVESRHYPGLPEPRSQPVGEAVVLALRFLGAPYREGGWTAAQVVHHMADSHMNAYIRTRFALAEDHFTVKPYDEVRWAQFPDAQSTDVAPSLAILDGLHARWAALLRTLTPADIRARIGL